MTTRAAIETRTTTLLEAPGPLQVSRKNPRYFTHRDDPSERVVYLAGSHIWNNFHDGLGPGADAPDTPEPFDYDEYLHFLAERGHNFIRLWRWEHVRSQAAGGNYHLNMSPQPWARTGPGTAKDGKPKFDLDRLDDAYFARLRERVRKAADAGIYAGVMLFDGWALHLSPAPDNVEGHPFHANNNISGIRATSINDLQTLPLDQRIRSIQRAYIWRVVDTLHDLPNVLWEVSNESTGDGAATKEFAAFLGLEEPPAWRSSTEWQYWVIDVVKRRETERGLAPHPIGITMQFPVADQTRVNEPLLRSRAEWISPGYDDEIFTEGRYPMAPGSPPSRWYADPPPADGAKVVITDTDHYAPGQGDALWAWKSFLRGHHPILMDFGLIGGLRPGAPAPGVPPFEFYEPARLAMGDTRRYADRIGIVDMQPRREIASTGFALVNPGKEYLVLEPKGSGEPFTVQLSGGRYAVEWFNVARRVRRNAEPLTIERDEPRELRAPFTDGPAVLYLSRVAD